MTTDEEILQKASKCSKMYLECVKEAITEARQAERAELSVRASKASELIEEIFEVWKCTGAISKNVECWEARDLSGWQYRMWPEYACTRCKMKRKMDNKDYVEQITDPEEVKVFSKLEEERKKGKRKTISDAEFRAKWVGLADKLEGESK